MYDKHSIERDEIPFIDFYNFMKNTYDLTRHFIMNPNVDPSYILLLKNTVNDKHYLGTSGY